MRCKHIGDDLTVRVLRDGAPLSLSYTLDRRTPLVPVLHGVDCVPSYFIVGGLVFVPLSVPFLEHAYGGHHWRKLAPVQVLACVPEYRLQRGQQVVVLFQVLSAELNAGFRLQTVVCTHFNGAPLHCLRQLAELVDGCSERYMRFGLDGGRLVILDRAAAIADGPRVGTGGGGRGGGGGVGGGVG